MEATRISLDTIKEVLSQILKDYPVVKATVFGSFAKGDATISSDLDLFIDSNGKLKGLDFIELLEILVSTLNIDIDLIDKSHVEKGSLIMKEIESKGLVIYEKSENYS